MNNIPPVPDDVLAEMASYYRERAPEYDEWFERRERYDNGAAENARWFAEAEAVFAALDALRMQGDVLELAPGTGIWTERLLRTAASVTAVDIAPEMLAQNRARVGEGRVCYIQGDLFTWQPDRQYDGVCFAFWLSHVPHERLDAFLQMVAAALRPDGKLFFVDSHRQRRPTMEDAIHIPAEGEEQVLTRKLKDGRAYRIVKNYYEPEELEARCQAAGLDVDVQETPTAFIYGLGSRRAASEMGHA